MSTLNSQPLDHLSQRRRVRNRNAARQAQINFFTEEIADRMFERLV